MHYTLSYLNSFQDGGAWLDYTHLSLKHYCTLVQVRRAGIQAGAAFGREYIDPGHEHYCTLVQGVSIQTGIHFVALAWAKGQPDQQAVSCPGYQ